MFQASKACERRHEDLSHVQFLPPIKQELLISRR